MFLSARVIISICHTHCQHKAIEKQTVLCVNAFIYCGNAQIILSIPRVFKQFFSLVFPLLSFAPTGLFSCFTISHFMWEGRDGCRVCGRKGYWLDGT